MSQNNSVDFGHILCAVQNKNNLWMYASVLLDCCPKGIVELRLLSYKTKMMEANLHNLATTPLNIQFFNDFHIFLQPNTSNNFPNYSIGQTLTYVLKSSSSFLSNKPFELQIIENNEKEKRILLILPMYGTKIVFCGNDTQLSPLYSTLYDILNANTSSTPSNNNSLSTDNFNWCWTGFSYRDTILNNNSYKTKFNWKQPSNNNNNNNKQNNNYNFNYNKNKNNLSKNNFIRNNLNKNPFSTSYNNNKLSDYLEANKENIPPNKNLINNPFSKDYIDQNANRKRYSSGSEYTEMEIDFNENDNNEKPLKRLNNIEKNFVLPSSLPAATTTSCNINTQKSLLFSDLLSPLMGNSKTPIITTNEASDDSFDYQLEDIFNVSIGSSSKKKEEFNLKYDQYDSLQTIYHQNDQNFNNRNRVESSSEDDFFIRFTCNNNGYESPNRSFDSETIEETCLLNDIDRHIDTTLNEELYNEKTNKYNYTTKFNKELNLADLDHLRDHPSNNHNNTHNNDDDFDDTIEYNSSKFEGNSSFMMIDETEEDFYNKSLRKNNHLQPILNNNEELSLAYFQSRSKMLRTLFDDNDTSLL